MSSILSVSQINKYIQFKIQSDLKLKGVAVKGEISNFTVHYKSGHAYFTLKDANSSLKAVMFSRSVERLKFMPENGMSVLVVGNIEVYERDGVYQIIANEIQHMGAGALHKGIEQLKDKLLKMGLCDEKIKKPIPIMPKKIAVVTSLTGAALQDIINVLSRRFPVCELLISPAQVQGEMAVDSICYALKVADNCGADTIILARGGGSLEDLMPFNTEKVAMAVAGCNTPIITAVGHETDTSVVDYVSDLRVPTPSAAAEVASPKISELLGSVDLMMKKMNNAMENYIAKCEDDLLGINHKLALFSPEKKLEKQSFNLNRLIEKLNTVINSRLIKSENLLDKFSAQLTALSPLNVLDRGYSITTKDGKVVDKGQDLNKGDLIEITFKDAKRNAQII